MSENRKKSRQHHSLDDLPELTSIEKSIAKYLRFQCSTKKGILMGMDVIYFNGSKAIECLMESKWSLTNTKTSIYFSSKSDAIQKKFKFNSECEQIFLDSINEYYIWIYSPTTIKQYIIGSLLLIGCITICLFPLWPSQIRIGVYYLSIILASLIGSLLSLVSMKYIIFISIWLITMGKIKFWLLPNLTEDVGFIESFIPLYIINKIIKDEKKIEVLVNINSNEQENEDKEILINEEKKRQKLSDDGFEVLSKDELEIN